MASCIALVASHTALVASRTALEASPMAPFYGPSGFSYILLTPVEPEMFCMAKVTKCILS